MNREQLEGHAHHLGKELEREREERNFFQFERDKSFWDITRKELDETKAELWAPLLTALIELFELPEDDSDKVQDVPYMGMDVEPNAGDYQTVYSKLTFAQGKEADPLAHISDAKLNLAQSLGKLSIAYPGCLGPLIQAGLSLEGQAHLERYSC